MLKTLKHGVKLGAKILDNLPVEWSLLLAPEKNKDYFKQLVKFLEIEYSSNSIIYPPEHLILNALCELDYSQVKIVILGQDPYHGEGQAMGRSFAVPNSLRLKPPSLQNIFKEIQSDLGVSMKGKGSDLSAWVEQGVLLLNTVLTVRASEAFSHRNQGWEIFTNRILELLNERQDPLVFILWGSPARAKKILITNPAHKILEAAHPSPLSANRGFFGCRHFSKSNEILNSLRKVQLDWSKTCRDSN